MEPMNSMEVGMFGCSNCQVNKKWPTFLKLISKPLHSVSIILFYFWGVSSGSLAHNIIRLEFQINYDWEHFHFECGQTKKY